jgi:hypothetical protein
MMADDRNDRIIIAKDAIKRELSFPFELCLSREAARWLRDQLKQADCEEWSYGWITVALPVDMQGTPSTQPLRWGDITSTENPPFKIER